MLTFDPGGHDRFVALRFLVVGCVLAAGLVTTFRDEARLSRPVGIAAWGVAATAALAVAFAADPLLALLGDPTRMGGAAATLLAVAALVLGSRVRCGIDVVAKGAFVVTAVVVALGLAEAIGVIGDGGRPGSSFGNAGLLGGFLALMVPLVVATLRAGVLPRVPVVALGVGALVLLAATQTRGAWIGAGVGVALVLAPGASRRVVLGAGIAAIVFVATVVAIPRHGDTAAPDTAQGRIDTWVVAARVIADRPLTGWGQEGFRDAFAREVDDEWVARYDVRQLQDRAHNRQLDIAASTGVIGLAADVTLIGLTGAALRRRLREEADVVQRGLLLGVAGGVVAYLVQAQFLFDTFDLVVPVCLLVGIALGRGASAAPSRIRLVPSVVAAALVPVIAIGVINVSGDRLLQSASGQDPAAALDRLKRAIDTRPRSAEAHVLLGAVARASGDPTLLRRAHDTLKDWDDAEARFADAQVLHRLGVIARDRRALRAAVAILEALAAERAADTRVEAALAGAKADEDRLGSIARDQSGR